jgi:hypothetical protein
LTGFVRGLARALQILREQHGFDDPAGKAIFDLILKADEDMAATAVDYGNCARCGFPRSEHHYHGACYGICGAFVSSGAGPLQGAGNGAPSHEQEGPPSAFGDGATPRHRDWRSGKEEG